METVWFLSAIAVCALLTWIGFRIEPHWVSKDGRRFMCNGQTLNARGEPEARWRETRVTIDGSNRIQVGQKRFMKRTTSTWIVASRSTSPPRGKEIFLLTGRDDLGTASMLALRLPKKSRAVDTLQSLLR